MISNDVVCLWLSALYWLTNTKLTKAIVASVLKIFIHLKWCKVIFLKEENMNLLPAVDFEVIGHIKMTISCSLSK